MAQRGLGNCLRSHRPVCPWEPMGLCCPWEPMCEFCMPLRPWEEKRGAHRLAGETHTGSLHRLGVRRKISQGRGLS